MDSRMDDLAEKISEDIGMQRYMEEEIAGQEAMRKIKDRIEVRKKELAEKNVGRPRTNAKIYGRGTSC